jgi:putative transferase (TIGR04331 family)
MFDDGFLQLVRGDQTSFTENVVYIDWWAAGGLSELRPNEFVLLHEFTEKESIALAEVEAELFDVLVNGLNQAHCTNHSRRYWRIILGAWHQEFFFTFADRYARLKKASETFRGLKMVCIDDVQNGVVLKDGTHFSKLTGSPEWETNFCSRLVRLMQKHGHLANVQIEDRKSFLQNDAHSVKIEKQSVLVRVIRRIDSLASFFDSFSKFELRDTYLSPKQEFLTRWRLGNFSFPRMGESASETSSMGVDVAMRRKLSTHLAVATGDDFFRAIASELMVEYLPANYVENFGQLVNRASEQLRKYPAVFFTSNRFGMSDTERLLIAEKVRRGTRYVVAQHGNNYGVTFRPNVLPEEETSDLFLRWGNAFGNADEVIGVITRGLRMPKKISKETECVLIVGSQPPARTFRYYDWDQYYASENHTVDLVSNLAKLEQKVLYRPYRGHVFGGGATKEFELWLGQKPVALSVGRFKEALSKSSVVVFMYDSTGFLELLSEGRPCLQIQLRPVAHVSVHFLPLYEDMIRVGLLHEDVSSAMWILQSSESVRGWWNSPEVIEVRESVSNALAVKNSHIVGDLARVLKKVTLEIPLKSD